MRDNFSADLGPIFSGISDRIVVVICLLVVCWLDLYYCTQGGMFSKVRA
jgi:hypothetical protein